MQLQNVVELIFASIIVFSSFFIYFRTKKLYDLTYHKGIKSFRDAFFYWGLAFFVRYLGYISLQLPTHIRFIATTISSLIFFYGLSMAGFSLVYSLIWKNLIQGKFYLLHITAIIISILNIFYVPNLMFYSQFVILFYGIGISYSNYKKEGQKHKFLQLYFIGLILAFAGYMVNFLSDLIIPYFESIIFYSYSLTICVFLIFVYGVIKVVKRR
jgi:hypothetical protein